MYTPNSIVYFLNVPFSSNFHNVMLFKDKTSQENYFKSKAKFIINKCSYVREERGAYLLIEKPIDNMRNVNYVMYNNTNFTDRYFYAFIDRLEYKNEKVTKVILKGDVWQTWQFDFKLGKSFIERYSDLENMNTLSDIVATGKLETVFCKEFNFNNDTSKHGKYFIFFNTNPFIDDASSENTISCDLGDYSIPCMVLCYDNPFMISKIIQEVSNKGRADRIQSAFFMPYCLGLNIQIGEYHGGYDLTIDKATISLVTSVTFQYETLTSYVIDVPSNLFRYTKEMSYPYAEFEIIDRITGNSIKLDLCKFENPFSIEFKIIPILNEKAFIKVVPLNYNGDTYSIQNSLIINCQCDMPIFNNAYGKYLKENRTSNLINAGLNTVYGVGSLFTGNVMGVASSIGNVANVINQESKAKELANQCSGINADTFDYINFTSGLLCNIKAMDLYHAQVARDFWKCFGYPIRKVTTYPLEKTGEKQIYIKTENVNIISENIPQEELTILEEIFNNGVNVWNNPNTFMEF